MTRTTALLIRKNKHPLSVNTLILLLAFMVIAPLAHSQNYSSRANGSWTVPATWNNTSGWGNNTPVTSGGNGTITVNHNVTAPSLNPLSASINISAGASLTVNGNFGINNGATVNVYGTLYVTGDMTLNANLVIHPGGRVVVDGNVTVINSTYLNVGTNVAPPQYADLVVRKNLISQNSGDVTINRNGRVAVFGNITNDTSGGTVIRVNDGGQAYVHGNVALVGGGDAIINNNTRNPYGLYVNGTTSVNSGQGSSQTSNNADQATLINTNNPFWQWVNANSNTPLPIKLAIFKIANINTNSITLTWTTTTEINFDKFIIEHSTNGLNFEAIDHQQSRANNSDTRTTYTFIHANPTLGRNYYRLKSVDLDTQFEYSAVIHGEFSGHKAVSLYPNPSADSHINLAINFAPTEGDNIKVYDIFGTLLQQNLITNLDTRIEFVNTLKPGTYIVKYASTSGNNHTLKFVVR